MARLKPCPFETEAVPLRKTEAGLLRDGGLIGGSLGAGLAG